MHLWSVIIGETTASWDRMIAANCDQAAQGLLQLQNVRRGDSKSDDCIALITHSAEVVKKLETSKSSDIKGYLHDHTF